MLVICTFFRILAYYTTTIGTTETGDHILRKKQLHFLGPISQQACSSIKEPIAYLHVFHPSIDAIHWHLDMHQYFIFSKICRTKRILPKNSCNVLQIIGFYITLEHIFHFRTQYVLSRHHFGKKKDGMVLLVAGL